MIQHDDGHGGDIQVGGIHPAAIGAQVKSGGAGKGLQQLI
jgi:hypothetical protein